MTTDGFSSDQTGTSEERTIRENMRVLEIKACTLGLVVDGTKKFF